MTCRISGSQGQILNPQPNPIFRPPLPKLADLMDVSEHDVLAYMAFPRQHRARLHSTNPIERPNKEVKRRADAFAQIDKEEVDRILSITMKAA